MKNLFLIFLTLGLSTTAWSHGNEVHEPRIYDPVDNEFGSYAPELKAEKTITVRMADTMRFDPDTLNLKKGDIVKFKIENTGRLLHEFVIGTDQILAEHAELMKKFPGMEHDEPYMAHVQPGKAMEITWRFDKPGRFGFACLLPGHFEAGMKGSIQVR